MGHTRGLDAAFAVLWLFFFSGEGSRVINDIEDRAATPAFPSLDWSDETSTLSTGSGP